MSLAILAKVILATPRPTQVTPIALTITITTTERGGNDRQSAAAAAKLCF